MVLLSPLHSCELLVLLLYFGKAYRSANEEDLWANRAKWIMGSCLVEIPYFLLSSRMAVFRTRKVVSF